MVNSHHWQESEDAWAGQQKSNENNWFTRLPWYDQVGVQATIGMNEAKYWENDASEEKIYRQRNAWYTGIRRRYPFDADRNFSFTRVHPEKPKP